MTRRLGFRHAPRLLVLGTVLLAFACSKKTPPSSGPPAEPSASASKPETRASASASAAAGPSLCKVTQEKRWLRWANREAGLTFGTLPNGRLALGLADGERPRVLVFNRLGTGELIEPAMPSKSALSMPPSASVGRRRVLRVTPALDASGAVTAYVDYRDERSDGRRRVACVPTATDQSRLVFDGEPLAKDGKPAGLAGEVAAAGTDKPELVTEVRDCRTFVDPGGSRVWAAGGRLVMEKLPNRTLKWRWEWFVDPGDDRPYVVLHRVEFEGVPTELPEYEPLSAQRLEDGTYLLAARQLQSGTQTLWLWGLGADRAKRTEPQSYPGPAVADVLFAPDGTDLWLLVSRDSTESQALSAAKLPAAAPGLPTELSPLSLRGAPGHVGSPGLVRAKDHRFLSYQVGPPGKGQLMVALADEQLQPQQAAFLVSDPEETVYTSRLVALDSGELLLVYIQNGAPGADLISKRLTCWAR